MRTNHSNVATFVVLACAFVAPSVFAATVHVTLSGFVFTPSTVSIDVGDTVHWDWVEGVHTITSGTSPEDPNVGNLFDIPNAISSPIFSHTYTSAGTFPYFCRPHIQFGMTGTVNVAAVEVLDPDNVYVDASHGGSQVGTANSPFTTIAAAVVAANANAIIRIAPGTYAENFAGGSSLATDMTLQVNGSGSVIIGLTLDLPDAFTGFVTREIPIRITE